MEPPSPVISDVMPWESLLRERLSRRRADSDWPSMSMKPGETIWPLASISRLAVALLRLPIAAMRSPWMATWAAYQGLPVPSMMWPLRMMMSYVPGAEGEPDFEADAVGALSGAS